MKKVKRVSDIKFYIPKNETIPTDLRLYVGDVYVTYQRIQSGFRFYILLEDEIEAMEIAKKIIHQMIKDHDESHHGVSWRTIAILVVPQEGRYKFSTIIDWKYVVRDSY